jgi:sugar (pentulose or hexulose) kinase
MAIIGLTAFITATTTGDIGDIAKRQRKQPGHLRRAAVLSLAVAHRCGLSLPRPAGFNFQNQTSSSGSTHQHQVGRKSYAQKGQLDGDIFSTSGFGAFRNSATMLMMSVRGGKADLAIGRSDFRK